MKTIRHRITRTKREVVVVLLMLAVSAAVITTVSVVVLTTGATNAQSPPPSDLELSSSHPCGGLSSIMMIVSAPTLVAGNDLTKQTTAPSGNCTLTVTLYTSAHTPADPQLGSGESCSVTVTPSLWNGGSAAEVQRNGLCGMLPVETRVDVSPESALPTGRSGASSSASGSSIARSRVTVRAAGAGGEFQSDVRGTWDHTQHTVTLKAVEYINKVAEAFGSELDDEERLVNSVGNIHIVASNRISWTLALSTEFSTWTSLGMRPNGVFSCGHWYSGIADTRRAEDSPFSYRGECFP